VTLLFWTGLTLLLLAVLWKRPAALLRVQVLAIVTVIATLPSIQSVNRHAHAWGRDKREAELAVMAGVQDVFALRHTALDPQYYMKWVAGRMKERSLSVFGGNDYGWFRKRIGEGFRIDPFHRCTGRIEGVWMLVDALWPGYRVDGWASNGTVPLDHIVLATTDGRVAGIASSGYDRRNGPFGYRGYVRGDVGDTLIQAYGVMPDGETVCPVSAPTGVGPFLGRLDWTKRVVLWRPEDALPEVRGGTASVQAGYVSISLEEKQTQVYFPLPEKLSSYGKVALKIRLDHSDHFEARLNRDGPAIRLYVSTTPSEWVYFVVNVPYYPDFNSAGTVLRFDRAAVSSAARRVDIAEIIATGEPPHPWTVPVEVRLDAP
jgi:hypothetical protein